MMLRSSLCSAVAAAAVAAAVRLAWAPLVALPYEGAWDAFQRTVARCRNGVLREASLRALGIEASGRGGADSRAKRRRQRRKMKRGGPAHICARAG